MNKIKIYELLGLIKDGKAPKKIKYNNGLFRYVIDENDYFEEAGSYLLYTLLSTSKTIDFLNTEVEIIEEEKEIEKFELIKKYQEYLEDHFIVSMTNIFSDIEAMFNELIDVVNKLKRDKE